MKLRLILIAAFLLCLSMMRPSLLFAAVGDAVYVDLNISGSSTALCQPGVGVEWIIHAIVHADDLSIGSYDGTNEIIFARDTAQGIYIPAGVLRVTNGNYLRLTNNNGSTRRARCIGVVTK